MTGTYDTDEAAIRFHQRLVAIHAFPNGNGRHGRIAADLLVQATGMARFSWGSNLRVGTPQLRSAYTQALQRADRGDVEALVAFART